MQKKCCLSVIFGCFSKSESATSGRDVDIAIEFDKSKSKTLLDLIGLEEGLSTVFKRKVDLGVFSSLNPLIVEDVKKEMLVIYQNTS